MSAPAQPASPAHEIQLTVEAADVDALGHVNNIVYVRWLQDVAAAHSRSVGYGYAELKLEGGLFVVRRHDIEYLRPAFLGERIAVRTHVESWKGAACERKTRIVRLSDAELLARATTTWAFVGAEHGRPRRIPQVIVDAFAGTPVGEGE